MQKKKKLILGLSLLAMAAVWFFNRKSNGTTTNTDTTGRKYASLEEEQAEAKKATQGRG